MNRTSRNLVIALATQLVIAGVVATPTPADDLRYELMLAGHLPGDPLGKAAIVPLTGGTILNLELYLLVQGDDGNRNNDLLIIGTGYLRSSNGGLLGDFTPVLVDPPFTFTNFPGVPGDRDGDGDLDLGTTGDGSLASTNGFDAHYNPPTGPFVVDGFVPAAAIGTIGDDWAYAKLLSVSGLSMIS